jgi:hypothetical protein
MRTLSLAVVVLLAVPCLVSTPVALAGQSPRPDGLEEFEARVSRYTTLRAELEKGLPTLTGSDDVVQVRNVETALGTRVRTARGRARQGDLFTPQATAAFRKILGQMDASTWKMIMDANPGAFPNRVNDSYPKAKPLTTMPPDLLARLPRLPEGLQYRFIAGDLILHDIRANLIVDRIPEAIPVGGPPRRDGRK